MPEKLIKIDQLGMDLASLIQLGEFHDIPKRRVWNTYHTVKIYHLYELWRLGKQRTYVDDFGKIHVQRIASASPITIGIVIISGIASFLGQYTWLGPPMLI